MTRFKVTVWGRGDRVVVAAFTVDSAVEQDAVRWGSTASDIAHQAAADYCDSGGVTVSTLNERGVPVLTTTIGRRG